MAHCLDFGFSIIHEHFTLLGVIGKQHRPASAFRESIKCLHGISFLGPSSSLVASDPSTCSGEPGRVLELVIHNLLSLDLVTILPSFQLSLLLFFLNCFLVFTRRRTRRASWLVGFQGRSHFARPPSPWKSRNPECHGAHESVVYRNSPMRGDREPLGVSSREAFYIVCNTHGIKE